MAYGGSGGHSSAQVPLQAEWEEEAGALTAAPRSALGPAAPASGHAAAQLHSKVLHMLLQSLAGVCLCPLLPCPLLLQLGQP